ncbi:hypothetical protein HDU97_004499 [Phlyctochytrium planicorne]|nr:hypothetical protein HDU97_004499 [Phlyctochytrium planicorne]
MLPLELLRRILWWAEDYTIAIKLESIFLGIPSTLPDRLTAFDDFSLDAFPISSFLTKKFVLFPQDVDASTVSLSVIAWLLRFQPELFWRRHGRVVAALACKGRLEALKLIAANDDAQTHAFDSISIEPAVKEGHEEVVRYLHETIRVPLTDRTLEMAATSGNLSLFCYLEDHGAINNLGPILVLAFNSGNVELCRYVLEQKKYPYFAHGISINDNIYPELEELIISTNPELMGSSIHKATREGNLAKLKYFTDGLGLSVPSRCVEMAAAAGHLDVLAFLVESLGEFLTSASVHAAVTAGQVETLKYIVSKDSRLFSDSVLSEACCSGHLNVVKYVHEMHPNSCLNLSEDERTRTMSICVRVMEMAAVNGHPDIVSYLSDTCLDISVDQAIWRAALNGHFDVVKILSTKASPSGLTKAFWNSCSGGHLQIAKFLHANGVSFEQTTKMAASSRTSLEVIKFLDELGLYAFTDSALFYAGCLGLVEQAKFIVSARPGILKTSACIHALTYWHLPLYSFLDRHLTPIERSKETLLQALKVAVHRVSLRPLPYLLSIIPDAVIDQGVVSQLCQFDPLGYIYDDEDIEFDGNDLLEFLAENHMGLSTSAIETYAREMDCVDCIRSLVKLGLIENEWN